MSTVNERILKLFTEREVLAEVTSMVEYIFDTGTVDNCPPFNTDDVEMKTEICCPDCGAEKENLILHLGRTIPVPNLHGTAPCHGRRQAMLRGIGSL